MKRILHLALERKQHPNQSRARLAVFEAKECSTGEITESCQEKAFLSSHSGKQ